MSAVPGETSVMEAAVTSDRLSHRRSRILREKVIELVLFLAALVSRFPLSSVTTNGLAFITTM